MLGELAYTRGRALPGAVRGGTARATVEHPLLQLQRSMGNRAVADLVHLQRRSQPAATNLRTDSSAFDAELDKLLATLKAQPEPPSFEVIAAASVGRSSRGEMTAAATRLWSRQRISFSKALRQVAAKNTAAGRNAPKPVHSPSGNDVAYARKAAVVLAPFRYERSSDLSGYSYLIRKNSLLRRAMSGEYDPVRIVSRSNPKGPTAAEMDAAIAKGITDLSSQLKASELGELMVNFLGHGGGGAVTGTDEKKLTPADLAAHAEVARLHGIKVLYVLDTCQSGPATMWARGEIARRAEAALPGGRQHPLIKASRAYRQAHFNVVKVTYGVVGAARLRIDRKLRGKKRREAIHERSLLRFTKLMALSGALLALPAALRSLGKAFAGIGAAPLIKLADTAWMRVLVGVHRLDSKRSLTRVAASMDALLDALNDLSNRVVLALTKAARERGPTPTGEGAP